jgi:serine/threonine-protein kinase
MEPEIIGGYQLLARLPGGDMRYRGRRAGDLRDFEVHIADADQVSEEDRDELFPQWEALRGCHAAHVHNVVDFGVSGQRTYIVYEVLVGQSLRELLQAQRQEQRFFSGPAAAALLLPGCRGLAELGQRLGFVHGRLGPDTVWVGDDGQAVVSGIAEPRLQRRFENMVGRPRAGRVDFSHLAPEQLRGLPLAPPADVFALGILLYELVSGVRPLRGESNLDRAMQLFAPGPLPSIAQQVPALAPAVAAVIDRALAKDPAQRYASTGELALALAAVAAPSAGSRVAIGAATQPQEHRGLTIEACAMKWEDLAPRPPLDGHPARHCARCDQVVVQAAGDAALGQALQGRCLHVKAAPTPEDRWWQRLLPRRK